MYLVGIILFKPMLPFPQKISLEQKYTHHVHSVFYIRNFVKASASGFLKKWPFEPQKFLKKEDI